MSDIPTLAKDLLTVRDLVRYGVSRFTEAQLFFGHGTDNAFDEAVYLVLHALHLPLDRLEPFLDARLLPAERAAALSLIERRATDRIPAAYLTHEAWLGDFRFYCDERVIVPRSYFAEMLENGFAPWVEPGDVTHALDMCTGSACLAILMAHCFPHARIDAVDISNDALEVARRNIADYQLEEQVEAIQSDLFGSLAGRRYDLIISNPPYVTAEAMAALPDEYRFEPSLALGAGDDGLDIVRRLLADAPAYLNEGGVIAIEIGHNRDIVDAAFPELELTWLSTETAEDKVFLVTREQLIAAGA